MGFKKISAFLFAITLILTVQSANAFEWSKAPLACSPDRAVKWNSLSEKEPCHCPPKSYCPDFNISPEDIEFTVDLTFSGGIGKVSHVFKGNEIPGVNPKSFFGQNNQQKKSLVTAKLEKMYPGYNFNYIVSQHGPQGRLDFFDLYVRLNKSNADDVLNSNSLPLGIATQCCDSICPAGTVPETKVIQVEREVPGQKRPEIEEDDDAATIKKKKAFKPEMELVDVEILECTSARSTLHYGREGCILDGTQITLADGKTAAINELKLGDKIMGKNGAVTITALNKFTQDEDIMFGINGGEAFISIEHPVLTIAGWKSIDPEITSIKSDLGVVGKLKVGDKIMTKDGTIEVITIDKHMISGGTSAYNLSVDDNEGFIANNILVKSFNQVQIHY